MLTAERPMPLRVAMIAALCAAGLLSASPDNWAQTVYRQVDATGHITFTDRREVAPADSFFSSPNEPQDAKSRSASRSGARHDVATALALNSAMTSGFAADVDFKEATRRLRQARQERRDGKKALYGEQVERNDSNGQYLRYRKRQQGLEREVVLATQRVEETLRARGVYGTWENSSEALNLVQP
jgi:hypothetical protein